MPQCPNCGAEIPDGADSDPNCGADLRRQGQPLEVNLEPEAPQDAGQSGLQPPEAYQAPSPPYHGSIPPPAPGGYAPEYGAGPRSQTWAVWSLVLGILSITSCPVSGPFAIWAGNVSRRSEGPSGMATAGFVLGIIGTAYLVIAILCVVGWLLAVFGLIGAGILGSMHPHMILPW